MYPDFYLLDNTWSENDVQVRDIGCGYAVKFDPLRDSKKWTAISGYSRLGDVDTIEEAIKLINKDLKGIF